jgi:hypothetical protein
LAQFLLVDLAANQCAAPACAKVASKHKWLLPGLSGSQAEAPTQAGPAAATPLSVAYLAARGPLATSFGSRALLDLKKRLLANPSSLGPWAESGADVAALVLGLDANRTAAHQAAVRGGVARAATAALAQACAATR